jgi:hypothetical protein
MALVGGPARRPIRGARDWCVVQAGKRRRLAEVVRHPDEPEEIESVPEVASDASRTGVGG